MDEPLVERIALDLKKTLEGVTTANGCHQDVAGVVRPTRLPNVTLTDRLILLGQGEPEEEEAPEGWKAWLQPFPILLCVRPSEKDLTPVDTIVNRFRVDVERAVMEDPQRGGLAIDTAIRPYDNVTTEDGALEGVIVHVEVHYRHRIEDPR